MMLFAWMPDLECGIGQERLPPPNLNHQKHPPQKPTVFVSSTVEHVIYIYIYSMNIFRYSHSIPWFLPITFFHPKTLKGAPAAATWDWDHDLLRRLRARRGSEITPRFFSKIFENGCDDGF